MSGELHPLVEESLELRKDLPQLHELDPEAAREQPRAITADPGDPPVGEVTDETIPGPAGELPLRAYRPEGEPRSRLSRTSMAGAGSLATSTPTTGRAGR